MAYTYKNEFVNFKLLVNQSVTSNMTIPKNIIDDKRRVNSDVIFCLLS